MRGRNVGSLWKNINAWRYAMSDVGRRTFLGRSAQVAAVAGACALAGSSAYGAEGKPMIGACGIACSTCPLMKAEKCKGCGPGNAVSAEMVAAKQCAVLSCASMKKIDYCGTACAKFADCAKLIGRPYDKDFQARIKAKLG